MHIEYKFQKMTPFDDVEMGIYEEAMGYIFSEDDIRNIAITGTYGAGKSSMVESYKKAHPEKKFIHISLAHFNSVQEEGDNGDDARLRQVAALEGKIINQLVHQIDSEKIPQTNFRIKRNVDDKHILKTASLVTIFIAIIFFLKFRGAWENGINGLSLPWLRKALYFTTTNEVKLLLGLAALVILWKALFEMIRMQKRVRLLRKLNIQGTEIEVFEDSKDSYFDKYLNEVLYIFEHAGVDGIIFEDIDRYDTNVIFEKLREINYLLNQRNKANEKSKQRQTIRFFYLLRDDLFASKDRTKFFDFILPVVPVVDASNAYDKFIDYFEKANLLGLFDRDFLQGLSLYVDDMRVLKNICNEFVIYHEKLKPYFTEQSNNKLLAVIVYKNIFPKDFGYLQTGRGYIHTLFANRSKFADDQIKPLQEKIDALQEENRSLNAESLNDIDELNAIYFLINGQIIVNNKKETDFKTRKEFVKAVLTSGNVINLSYGYEQNIHIEKERKAMEENPEYFKRKELIEKKRKAGLSKNNRQISRLKKQIEELEHNYLKDIITRENETVIFQTNYINPINEEDKFEEVKRSPYFNLLKFLIREGYLDETYPDYMTYFYENSITVHDKSFLRSIMDRHAKPYDYRLDNAALVISRMRMVDFTSQEALNFCLLDHLLSDRDKYGDQLQSVLHVIWDIEPAEFVSQYLERSTFRERFVEELNIYWAGANHWVITTDEFTMQQKRCYVKDTLCVSSDKVIAEMNQDGEIKRFVENDSEFLAFRDINEDMVLNRLSMMQIKFRNINFKTANAVLLQYVYNNDMYVLNMDNVNNILMHYYGIPDEHDLLRKNLTFILSGDAQPLYRYVMDNMDLYMGELLSAAQETEDAEETVLFVLNSDEASITEEHKKAYIAASKTVISHLNEVDDVKWWGDIVEQDKVQKTAGNLREYYFKSGRGMDDRLVHFINGFEQAQIHKVGDMDDNYEESEADALFSDITKCNKIKNDIYKEIVCSFDRHHTTFSETEVEPEKMEILIDNDILEMNADILKAMRKSYAEMSMRFIMANIGQYVEIMNKSIFSHSELLQILDEGIDDELKLRLLQFAAEPVSIQKKCYSDRIQDYIVEHLYCNKDFEFLVHQYSSSRAGLKKQILDKAKEAVLSEEELSCVLPGKLLEGLILSGEIDTENMLVLLAQQIEIGLQKGVARAAFERLGLPEYMQLLDGKQSEVAATDTGQQLLEALKARKWISEYAKDKDDPKMFRVYGRVSKKVKATSLAENEN